MTHGRALFRQGIALSRYAPQLYRMATRLGYLLFRPLHGLIDAPIVLVASKALHCSDASGIDVLLFIAAALSDAHSDIFQDLAVAAILVLLQKRIRILNALKMRPHVLIAGLHLLALMMDARLCAAQRRLA